MTKSSSKVARGASARTGRRTGQGRYWCAGRPGAGSAARRPTPGPPPGRRWRGRGNGRSWSRGSSARCRPLRWAAGPGLSPVGHPLAPLPPGAPRRPARRSTASAAGTRRRQRWRPRRPPRRLRSFWVELGWSLHGAPESGGQFQEIVFAARCFVTGPGRDGQHRSSQANARAVGEPARFAHRNVLGGPETAMGASRVAEDPMPPWAEPVQR